ncbi:PREDICTED: sodium bicarbonate cotransporter 3 isoform X3 [Nicrophorus vespilloides]|uniref:Anion exchange protein n=1 Tax=Nicrophorus vespilloides TaxID=110193 RepID=A0ABM1MXT5_NICVS|nr:PREDICTED: sodium bicarbonate cotransporter 3 isoform X3 [Nicrophorus vespilloides]
MGGRNKAVDIKPRMDPHDDEAPKDPGAQNVGPYDEKDFEGHRAHSVFVGVHIPVERRHSHRRHKHHHRSSECSAPEDERPRLLVTRRARLSISEDGELCTPPAQRVQFILGEEIDDGTQSHPLFSEMEELVGDGDDMEWKETARWIKFEEDVEEGGNRWSKPHVATLSLHSLFELRSLLLNGTVLLDMEAISVEQIADLVIDNMVNAGTLPADKKEKVRETLLKRHRHQHQRKKHVLPLIRSFADIGRNHSSSKNGCFNLMCVQPSRNSSSLNVHVVEDMTSSQKRNGSYISVPGNDKTPSPDSLTKSSSAQSISRNHSSNNLEGANGDIPQHNLQFMRKIPPGAEASNILVGEVDFLDKTVSAFIRLNAGTVMGDLTEVPVPTRFLFVLLTPNNGNAGYHEIGRAMATLMSDEVFHEVAYRAKNRSHLLAGIDEFLDAVTVLPPGEWDPAIRIEPPAAIPSQDVRKRPPEKPTEEVDEQEEEAKQREESGLARSGRLFGGLINDLKRKTPFYWSDFKDALSLQCIASWIFLYFACLSPIITFGGLLSEATGKNMAAMESLVSGFVCGLGYGLFSGQPLTILGSTGPVLVFETIVYEFCQTLHWDYLSFRFWIGAWIAVILLILVAVDASALVCYITRFTEENFATLIAFIFIYKAVENVILIGKKFPINTTGLDVIPFDCDCFINDSVKENYPEVGNWSNVNKTACLEFNGTLIGEGCFAPHYVPDVFLMSIILFLGTFILSVQLKDFKNALFFPAKVRAFISDFAVIIAILSMSLMDYVVGISTPKLEVPHELKPTLPNRGWIVSPFMNPIYSIFLAILPALLGTILIFMDQQITSVIINRKENKLKKGCGYHLDLFILSILIMICSLMGLPWFVAATVLSINHVNSLKQESECAAPGEKPQFLGVREQRVTHILIFLTIGLSVFLTPMLGHIPMPVLFGVFLYMGVASLKGLQFFDRILIIFMPVKYQPDYMFLRQVPLKRVHIFTLIQIACLVCLWVIKSFSTTSILFPLMLVVMIGIRKSLDLVFTRRELKILDDVMPEMSKRTELAMIDVEGKPLEIENSGNLKIPLANGNVMNIPLSAINISEEVNKTGIWKQVNQSNKREKEKEKKKSPHKVSGRFKKKKHSKKDDKPKERNRLEKRLSTMDEEDEDEGITIKLTCATENA